MMTRLSDILSSNQLNRKFIQAYDKDEGIVILKPSKHGKATYDGKNKKQKRKTERMKDINNNLNEFREEGFIETY